MSALFFVVAAVWAQQSLVAVWAFIPIYESALVSIDLITAVLLWGVPERVVQACRPGGRRRLIGTVARLCVQAAA